MMQRKQKQTLKGTRSKMDDDAMLAQFRKMIISIQNLEMNFGNLTHGQNLNRC